MPATNVCGKAAYPARMPVFPKPAAPPVPGPPDAEVREDIVMRKVGHASREINQRYNHPMIEAHLAASHQVSALVRKAGERT